MYMEKKNRKDTAHADFGKRITMCGNRFPGAGREIVCFAFVYTEKIWILLPESLKGVKSSRLRRRWRKKLRFIVDILRKI